MKRYSLKWLMAGALMTASLTGCGGGGSSASNPAPQQSAGNTVITGTASAGIMYPGTVKVYAVNASGAKGAQVGSAETSVDGKYRAALGGYSGAVDVEASGTYTDEATRRQVTIPSSRPLHALVDKVNETTDNNRVVSVTPLTDLAWHKASTNGTTATTPAAMVTANKLVDDLFKISDIVGTEPVRADNASMATASPESQAYTLALAVISTMSATATGATDNDKMEATIASLETEIEGAEISGSMSSKANSDFATALGADQLSRDFPSAAAQLSGVGKKSQKLTISTSGTLPAGTKIFAIDGTIALPASVSFRAEESGNTVSDVFLLAGLSINDKGSLSAKFLAPQQTLQFIVVLDSSGLGIGIGDFATLTYEVASGATITKADFSFVTGTVAVLDVNGAVIPGVAVTIN